MSALHDPSVDPPHARGCCCTFASALCKIEKVQVHVAIVAIIFVLVFLGFVPDFSYGSKIVLESVSYPAIVCLYIYSSSSRKERLISGIFLGVLAVVIVIAAPSVSWASHVPIFVCNLMALLTYCAWRFWAQNQACLLRLRRRVCGATAAEAALVHVAIVVIIFVSVFLGFVPDFSYLSKIVIESVSYPAIVCLYIYSSSSRKERLISGINLGVLAVVIIIAAPSASWAAHVPIFACNLMALLTYCAWRFWALNQACLLRRRVRVATAAEAALGAPQLLSVQPEEEAGCCSPVQQHAAFSIEELPREFTHDELRAVTGDFGSVVGRGGSAEVFRGVLEDGTAVAVKRIIGSRAVGEADFLREISIVANVHHRSLVRLLGYCLLRSGGDEGHGQFLVYPFFEHGSLDWWLFHGEERRRLLPWPTRRRVAVDVARALAYLHHECHRQILHLDIKPVNILLDGGLRAHVSDFGISMSIAWDRGTVKTCGRGTPGYMAPEVWASALSAKSDVYSYGVTLLELVAGRRCFDHGGGGDSSSSDEKSPEFFPSVVWEKMARGDIMEVADAAMARVEEREVEAVVKVALCCIQPRRETRPSMLSVVDMLEARVPVDLPPESRLSVENFSVPSPVDSWHRS